MVPEGMCVHVNPGKPRDQALEVFDHFNIQVTTSDIFHSLSGAYVSCNDLFTLLILFL